MVFALVLMFIAIVFTGLGQVLLKTGSKCRKSQKFWDPYLNPATFAGYCLYLASTLFLLYSLQEIPLKLFAAVSSLNFIIVLLFSGIFLGERITRLHILAILLITAGVAVFNLP